MKLHALNPCLFICFSQATPDHFSATAPQWGSKLEHYETNYMDYLIAVRPQIVQCIHACYCWSAPYDGENPSPDSLLNVEQAKQEEASPKKSSEEEVKSEGETTPQQKQNELTNTDSNNSDSGAISSTSAGNASQSGKSLPAAKSLVKEQYAESIVSEADSALSGSSNNTDSLAQITTDTNSSHTPNPPASRTDSPLNDQFDNDDFTAFLATLQRVKTPVEFCDSLEKCLSEIDSAADLAKSIQETSGTSKRSPSSSSNCDSSPSMTTSPAPATAEDNISPKTRSWSTESDSKMTRFDSLLNLDSGSGSGGMTSSSSMWKLSGGDAEAAGTSSVSAVNRQSSTGGAGTVFTPTKYNLGKPDIGK